MSLFVVTATGTHASAEPTPAEIEKQIDDEWNRLEPIIEQYNEVHAKLKENQQKLAQLDQQLRPLELQVDRALARVGEIASRSYKTGSASTLNVLLSGDSADQFMAQLTLLNHLARTEREQIASVAQARDRFAGDKKVVDDLVAQLGQQDAELAGKKKEIETKIVDLQKKRQQLYGSTAAPGSLKPVACPVEYVSGGAGQAAAKACSLIGKPYIFGAAGPTGYDCSGMTMTAWAAGGQSLAHFTRAQWNSTKPISAAERRTGDLVFFYNDLHHVGLYVGGGWMVHAPTTGDFVRMGKIEGRPLQGYRRVV